MKYLREQNPQEAAPTLMPPDEFKTRRQLRHLKKVGEGNSQNFHIKFQKKEDEGHHHGHGAARFKKSAHIIQDLIMLEHFSSNHEQDWIQRVEAGVVIWINKGTGEVSTVRPWGDDSTPKHDNVASLARLHPQLLKSKSGTNDILHRISMLKDHDSVDHKSNSSPRSAPRHTISASPRPGIKPTSSSSPRVASARPSTSASPRTHVRLAESKSDSKGDLRRPELEAKRDHRYLEPETKSDDNMGQYDEYLRDAEEMEHELGTGALVYDGSEVDNFFALLDGMK